MVVDIDAVMTRTLYGAEHVDMGPNIVIGYQDKKSSMQPQSV